MTLCITHTMAYTISSAERLIDLIRTVKADGTSVCQGSCKSGLTIDFEAQPSGMHLKGNVLAPDVF